MQQGDIYLAGDLNDNEALKWRISECFKIDGRLKFLAVCLDGSKEGRIINAKPDSWLLRQRGGVNVTTWVPADQADILIGDKIRWNKETYLRSAVDRVIHEVSDDWVELRTRLPRSEVEVRR